MVAVVIDPWVCKSALWWMFPECWGIAVMVGAAMGAWVLAATVRRVGKVRA